MINRRDIWPLDRDEGSRYKLYKLWKSLGMKFGLIPRERKLSEIIREKREAEGVPYVDMPDGSRARADTVAEITRNGKAIEYMHLHESDAMPLKKRK